MSLCSLADQGASDQEVADRDLDNKKDVGRAHRRGSCLCKGPAAETSSRMSAVAGAEGKEWEWREGKPRFYPRPLSGLPLLCAYTTLLGLALAAVLGNEAIFRYDSPLLWA